ncbi:hypothetical protein D5086_021593 [Populus alba]|uniref:Uncharacterized protein n=1 Tax=Populus alba TaxID=43335 RepID=A0ACC4BD58_POPAL
MAGSETISQKVRLECSTAAVEATYVYDVVKQYLYLKLFFETQHHNSERASASFPLVKDSLRTPYDLGYMIRALVPSLSHNSCSQM